ncbi:hypothetical protein SPBR_04167 [Sporothrix brasiliensis 5110]|uniref:Cytochrome p450 monooxygenase n=1 Tax=Sporothrix brasiliensis 5110 TaxID=1398154 RepID=A0A0C2J2P8_9PEZI|nr:uncharacterized protein SPBR_04167 [Sporothrix brasiliensis 5110]KIH93320.1 hypothetical protein SPBR_04167 [Sporothrix brasiliensis 5110]
MAHTWLVAFLAVFGAWLVSSAHRLYVNYRNAVRSGFPVLLCPVNTQNPLYMALNPALRPLLKRILPTAVYDRWHPATYGWEFRDRHGLHDRIGPVFVLVTTGVNELWCADPALAQILLARRKDFVMLPEAKLIMSLLGNNMIASDGETWARQRRLIAPNLNERISAVVWKESMAQANQMGDFMLTPPEDGGASKTSKTPKTSQTVASLRAIAINVLGQVGYGQPKPFRPMELPRDPEAPMAYIDAIGLVAELLAAAALFPNRLLALPFMPKVVQTLAAAMRRLPALTDDMLDQERQRQKERKVDTDSGPRETIMGLLVRLSDQALNKAAAGPLNKTAAPADPHGALGLTEDEIAGNLFLVTGAGFDTTANTMSYAAVLLAIYPETQAWLQEELDRVFGGPPTGLPASKRTDRLAALDYATVYPQLARCLAFMLETLRLYPAVLHVSRGLRSDDGTSASSATVTVHHTTHHLAGRYNVFVNNMALHTAPATWGADADAFRPARWIAVDAATGRESVRTPPRGTFSPWSGGPRVCPGQKMSQVEFVAVMATLLWRCSVRPVVRTADGETPADARARLLALTEDSQPRLTLQMNRPDEAELQWVER